MKYNLGLDVGSNSIGWALVEDNTGRLLDTGVRIFTKAVEDKTPTPKNQKRRDARLARRVIQRRAKRKQKLTNYLVIHGLLPLEVRSRFGVEAILNGLGNPYELRAKALDSELSPHDLGRVLLHFVARRGFLSTKKQHAGDLIDDPDTQSLLAELDNAHQDDKEEGLFKEQIATLRAAIEASGMRTLGEYLCRADIATQRNRIHDGGDLRTERAMYVEELEQIWEVQKKYHSLPANFYDTICDIIFYQRPLKLKKDRVGKCEFETSKPRARMARPEFQEFRILQLIHNLKYFEPQVDAFLELSSERKKIVIDYLQSHQSITSTILKKLLGLSKVNTFNIDAKQIKGNSTHSKIHNMIGAKWEEFDADTKDNFVEDVLSFEKKSALKERLLRHWKLTTEEAVKICLIEFESGHANLSLKTIRNLLPHLREGYNYYDSLERAGYTVEEDTVLLNALPPHEMIPNPIVNRAINEIRKVTNSIIEHYGKPHQVRIELARDLEENTKHYKRSQSIRENNEKLNTVAKQEFLKYNPESSVKRDDKIKYRLWQEQNEQCVYSGTQIPIESLWTDAIEIDHIVPRSRCLDDSYTNKVVALTTENRVKGNFTPIEKWGDDEEKWNQISNRIADCYKDSGKGKKGVNTKRLQFYMTDTEIHEKYGMSEAQLNDTRYITKLALKYYERIIPKTHIISTKGAVVARMRKDWGLHYILNEKDNKNRTDHRHHAVDAVVIAYTSRGLHKKLVNAIKQEEQTKEYRAVELPKGFAIADVKQGIDSILVSHHKRTKPTGAFHEETAVGYSAKHGGFVYRKTLGADFTLKQAKDILDDQVRTNVLEHVSHYTTVKEAFNETNLPKLRLGKNPIKRVRILQSHAKAKDLDKKYGAKDKEGKVFRYNAYGNNHHVVIAKHIKTGKIHTEYVTAMQAYQRMNGVGMPKQPIVTQSIPEHEIIMVLFINDMVTIVEHEKEYLYRVQKLSGNTNQITFRLHTDSTTDKKDTKKCISINSTNIDKHQLQPVKISILGKRID